MSEARISAERLLAHVLLVIIVLTLLYFLLPAVWLYLSPFILAIPFAALIQPATRLLEKKMHCRHHLAVLIPLVVLILVVSLCVLWFLSFGINQISYLLSHSNDVIGAASSAVRSAISAILSRFADPASGDTSTIWSIIDNVISYLSTQLTVWAGSALNTTVNWAASIPYALLYLNFLFFGIYFIARDYDHLLLTYHRGILGNPDTQSGKLANSAVVGLMGWLRCQAIYALLSLIVGSIYWTIFGYQYAILISLAAAILEFLPIVGNGTIYLPWGIIGLLIGQPRGAILALVLFFGLLLVRRLTEPRLLSHNIGVSPLLSLMSMFAGLKFGGLLGMIGSPMIAAVLTTLWEGDLRKTMRHDSQVIFHYLSDRWHGVTAVPHETKPQDPPTPESPKEAAPTDKDQKPGKRQRRNFRLRC